MTFRISLFFLNFCWAFSAAHAYPDKSWIQKYQSPNLIFPTPSSKWSSATAGRHPRWVHKLLNETLAWDPQDQTPRLLGLCSAEKLYEDLMSCNTPHEKSQVFEVYRSQCEKSFAPSVLFPPVQDLKLFTMAYQVDENPFLHRVIFQLPNGQKLKGVLALKDQKKRPLVVLRMGITGNVEEAFAERFLYYQLFERGLFHFLMVENMTSTDFIHHNQKLEFAGLAEAYQNLWIAQNLKDQAQPLSKLIESLHFVGLSLGGQGVLASAWLLPYQQNPDLIQSFLGLCPLVNLKDTFDFLFRKSWLRFPVEIWARSRFQELHDFRPDLFRSSFWGLPIRILETSVKEYRKPDSRLWGVVEPAFLSSQNDFYFLHDLTRWDPKYRKPIWIWATRKDPIVPVDLNVKKLTQVTPLMISEGRHCSFPAYWDARVMQALFRSQILGNSRFQFEMQRRHIPGISGRFWNLLDVRFPTGQQVDVDIISDQGQIKKLALNLQDLDFDFRGRQLGTIEKAAVRRWLSTNLVFEVEEGGTGMTVSWPFVKEEL